MCVCNVVYVCVCVYVCLYDEFPSVLSSATWILCVHENWWTSHNFGKRDGGFCVDIFSSVYFCALCAVAVGTLFHGAVNLVCYYLLKVASSCII
jgi:hypothetical protein